MLHLLKLRHIAMPFTFCIICLGLSTIGAKANILTNYAIAAKTIALDTDSVYTTVETAPVPKGGIDAFYKFIAKNIRYPAADHKYGIQGRTLTQFVIEKDGSLDDIKVIRAPSNTLADETLRIFKLVPNWSPGLKNGKPVRVLYTVPLSFTLDAPDPAVNTTNTDLDKYNVNKYFTEHIKYPESAKTNKVTGILIVTLNIEKRHITTVTIQKELNAELDAAVSSTLQAYPDELSVKDGKYSVILHFGNQPIDTNALDTYTQGLTVADLIQVNRMR